MPLSSFALILGIACYVFGFPLVFSDSRHLEWRRKLYRDDNAVRLLGMAIAMIAAVTLKRQWVVSSDGEGLIIAIAWFALAKSMFMAWWPAAYSRVHMRMETSLFSSMALQAFIGFVTVLLGAFFTYIGILLP